MELIDEAQLFAANAGSIATVQLLAMFPVDDDLALKATFKQADRLQHRRFARTRRAEQRDDLARLQGEVDPAQHMDRLVALGEAAFEDRKSTRLNSSH